MSENDEAYEIKITPLISHNSAKRTRKVEAVQTKTLTFFRYVYAAIYRGCDAIIDQKIFLDEEEAIAYWNQAIARLCTMRAPTQYVSVTA